MTYPVSRRPLLAGGVIALLLAACSSAASVTPLPSGAEPPSDCANVENGVIEISADNLAFSAPCMVANAGEAFTIHFTNQESIPHNVTLYEDDSKTNEILRGETVSDSGGEADYEVEALDAGQYFFDCFFHPNDMNGALYVVEP